MVSKSGSACSSDCSTGKRSSGSEDSAVKQLRFESSSPGLGEVAGRLSPKQGQRGKQHAVPSHDMLTVPAASNPDGRLRLWGSAAALEAVESTDTPTVGNVHSADVAPTDTPAMPCTVFTAGQLGAQHAIGARVQLLESVVLLASMLHATGCEHALY